MEDNYEMQELIAGYALGSLDEDEQGTAENLIKTNPVAQKLLADFQQVVNALALSASTPPLPAGSLDRLRQKAGVAPRAQSVVATPTSEVAKPQPVAAAQPAASTQIPSNVTEFRPRARRSTASLLAWAAVVVLFITSAIMGTLWFNTNQNLSDSQRNSQALTNLLASPNLKVSDLKPTDNSTTQSIIRLYSDASTNQAYLVSQNLAPISSDQVYEAWLITGDQKADKAGLIGTGGSGGPTVYALSTKAPMSQYALVAITVEQKGGVDQPQHTPILAGAIS